MKKHKITFEKSEKQEKNSFRAKILTGFFVILFGVLILLRQMGIDFPEFLLSWKFILILVGLVDLVKKSFKSTFGYILILIGVLLFLMIFILIPFKQDSFGRFY
jgi:hypothetical protein